MPAAGAPPMGAAAPPAGLCHDGGGCATSPPPPCGEGAPKGEGDMPAPGAPYSEWEEGAPG